MTDPKIVFEDQWYTVVIKPCGMGVQGGESPTLAESLGVTDGWNGVLHRLDTPVYGLVLWAKTPVSLERGMELFRTRRVEKTYWAVTEKSLPEQKGRLIHFLKHIQAGNKTLVETTEKTGFRRAALDYTLIYSSDRYFFYEIHLLTGRTHQIRAQLSKAGAPIKGDVKYGARRSNPSGGIHLLSRKMEFTHPFTGKRLIFTADPPEDPLWNLVREGGGPWPGTK